MARDVSRRVLARLGWHPYIVWRRITSPIRARHRRRQRQGPELASSRSAGPVPADWTLRLPASALASTGWAFVEDVLDRPAHAAVVAAWPPRNEFAPMRTSERTKTYDTAGRLRDPTPASLQTVHPGLQDIYCWLSSPATSTVIADASGFDVAMRCYWLLANESFWGSGLAPHRDTPATDSSGFDRRVNLIYFVDANGRGWDAGGTSILATNDFSAPTFVPTNLRNSALIYRTGARFFHGFPPMKFGKYRRVITAHYCPIED